MTADSGPLVLLADEDAIVRTLGRELLTAAGFRVVVATSGEAASRAFGDYSPDVVIASLRMPSGDGLELCRSIRSGERPETPVLITIGGDDPQDLDAAFAAGATDFMRKPLPWVALPLRLRYVLRSAQTLHDLTRTRTRARAVLDAIPDQLFLLDGRGVVVEDIRHAIGARSGLGAGNVAGKALEDILPATAARAIREQLGVVTAANGSSVVEYHVDEAQQVHETRLVPQPGDQMLAIVRDVTDRHRAEQRIRQLANYDDVTGLPNRALFMRELRRALRASRRSGRRVALLYIDLDRFKRINDTLGHSVGDALLKGVGERLVSSVRPYDTIATPNSGPPPAVFGRLGGDEFVAILTELELKEQAAAVANRVRQMLAEPFTYEGRQFAVAASIGIAVYPDDSQDVESLVMNADTAMYQAKAAGGNTIRLYDQRMNSAALERLELEGELRTAIERNVLELHLQPKHELATGRLTGAEALLRWKHATRGWISPAQFVPLAEESGLIVPLGEWVIEESCRILAGFGEPYLRDVVLSFNVSAGQVIRSDVAATVLRAVARHAVAPERLELEITESLLMRDLDEARKVLDTLKGAGLKVALDDFGTGYSSLAYLRQLPLDALKIDRSFVQQSHQCADDAAICAAIIAMGKKLGLRTIAEGLELEEQRAFLLATGCDEGQGYFFGRAMPPDEFRRYAKTASLATGDSDAALLLAVR